MSTHENLNNRASDEMDAWYEEQASQEEIYLEGIEESLRIILMTEGFTIA